MDSYDPKKIEGKWQKTWEEKKTFLTDIKKAKKPYYNLMMFPYPSAEGLHIGNMYAFTGSDIYGRFQLLQGNDVFEPMGFDSFGIHSENFAIKQNTHPKEQTAKSIKNFTDQLKSLGAIFAWDHSVTTSDAEYYKWTQWLFLQLYKAGLAYKAAAPVDWCPSCKTVLADEQVIDGKCERCGTEVVQKELEQWFLRITKYADRLLKNLDKIDWSEPTKVAQRNWIGKSEGAKLHFAIKNREEKIEVFTTRPDTLFGVTYMVLAPEHDLVDRLKSEVENWEEIVEYRKTAAKKNEFERTELSKEKTGVELKGIKVINPANGEEIPVWIADYVLATYGTGAIMAVPAHDQRDFEFAEKFKLPITMVVCPHYPAKTCPVLDKAYLGEGHLVASGKFDGMESVKAKGEIVKAVNGEKTINYHLRDWLISRQRYWGPPIPIIYCDKCGTVPVPEKDLPVELPDVKDFRPTGTDKSPLATVDEFVQTTCPECKGEARRETDVSDTFLDSAWYFLRYPSSDNKKEPFDKSVTKKWLPVDMYIGGQEHAVLHLLYSRFITMALHDMKLISFEEPFEKFRAHGLLIRDGKKISKSRGNVINPDEYIEKYGADTVRAYLMFLGPLAEGGDWSDRGIIGVHRFLNKVWVLAEKVDEKAKNKDLERAQHKTVKKVGEDIEELRYNTAIASLMEYTNALSQADAISKEQYETLLIMTTPFAPHITEELWQTAHKDSVHEQKWPTYNKKLIQEDTVRLVLQINGKVRDVIEVEVGISQKEAEKLMRESKNVQKWLDGKEPKKIIFVPNKLVNIVI